MTITSLNIADGTVGRTRMIRLKKRYIIIALILLLICICIGLIYHFGLFDTKITKNEQLTPPNPTKPLPLSNSILHSFKKAAVCVDAGICAEIGKSVLEKNGSAVDATIAAMFCNGFVTMQSMGLGGGFLMTIYIRENRTAYTLNAREKAPFKAHPNLYKDDPLKSQNGPLSVAVPGELRGYWTAYKRFGKLPWVDIVQPSIELCENGYNMTKHQYESLFKSKLHPDSNFKDWFYEANGKFKIIGTKIIPTKLCQTLRLIAQNGGDDLYNGTLSKLFLEDIQEIGGLITKDDMANYTAEWLEPITTEFKNKQRLYSFPPPGSGILLSFILNILDGYGFNDESFDGINNTVHTYHRIIEAFKYAYAKRTELGDMNFVNITQLLRDLSSKDYARKIREKINDSKTSNNFTDYGAVFHTSEDHGTAHLSVLAENGDAVSVTSSINIYFGAGLTSKQTGIVLNSVMDDFSFPNFKNYFGLPGSPNNELLPGKRPLSSMTPTIITDGNGDVKLVIGASGGTKITTTVALVIMRILWFNENIKEAIDGPRLHHQLFPMQVEYEYGTLQQIVDGLNGLGHEMKRFEAAGSIICALLRRNGQIFANADHRKGGDVYGIN